VAVAGRFDDGMMTNKIYIKTVVYGELAGVWGHGRAGLAMAASAFHPLFLS
jgi:hypothetical protein